MVYGVPGVVAGGASHAARIADAIKASGVLVRVTPEDFASILGRSENPLVVVAEGGVFSRNYQYLTSYKGLAFHTKATTPLTLPAGAALIAAGTIWMPG